MHTIRYVALLRGINVGGHNKLAMADLRALMTAHGLGDVRTYVQSGNAVFTGPPDAARLEADLAAWIAAELGVAPTVLVRTAAELAAVEAGNPYRAEAEADPTKVHAAFLSRAPADPAVFDFDATYAPEALTVGDRVLYLHLPGGGGRSRLAIDLAKRRAGVEMTIRNWRTVRQLVELSNS